ncbi:MAG TPA: RluA family pseudouridine synthase [Solirubrobacteraceae bacterium]|nr:RluA family pseudouridine synthase [Solirubrobacteraceae bacterium]
MGNLRLEASSADEGARLDHYLGPAVGSRAQAQRLIEAGLVTVDGLARPKRHRLSAGEVVEVGSLEPRPSPEAPAEDATPELTVAFEDEHLLIVDKPAGVVVHPGRGHPGGTLAQALAGRAAGGAVAERAGIVHRLDRDTSGLLVVARSEAVHRRLQALIAARKLTREYLALVEGLPGARSGTIDAPLGRDRHDRLRVSTDTDVPRAARTHFVIERALPATALLRVRLETGRTHQIRAHLLAIGHPVCGDPQYGREPRFGLRRQFLHAERLAFDHPITGRRIDVRSALPADLAAALARAERGED